MAYYYRASSLTPPPWWDAELGRREGSRSGGECPTVPTTRLRGGSGANAQPREEVFLAAWSVGPTSARPVYRARRGVFNGYVTWFLSRRCLTDWNKNSRLVTRTKECISTARRKG